MKVAFIHPDLGIGGAERLVVDAAVGLQERGHEVIIYTSHCDKSHAFEEVKDGTLKVEVLGNTIIPPKIFGMFAIICAILRQLHLLYLLVKSGVDYDIYIVDQLSACVPFLRLYQQGRIIFYGHFPDQLLAKRTSLLKSLYRYPFDWFEKWSTSYSDVVVVNSKFTRKVFKNTMRLPRMPEVVYPCVDTKSEVELDGMIQEAIAGFDVLISVNRFEKTKKIDLAVEAFAKVANQFEKALLVVAGGYDKRVEENIENLRELQDICEDNSLQYQVIESNDNFTIDDNTKVLFLPSCSTTTKNTILKQAKCLLYTPKNEHFGIVPLESMLVETPVIATNTGGPLETLTEQTGWNIEQDVDKWANIIKSILSGKIDTIPMGQAGKQRVLSEFSRDKMAKKFEDTCDQAKHVPRVEIVYFANVMSSFKGIFSCLLLTLLFSFVKPYITGK